MVQHMRPPGNATPPPGSPVPSSAVPSRPTDAFDDLTSHALPGWFAWFQKTFGLSFLVLASAYLFGKLATLGWVPDINAPGSWGVFNGVGVVIFFLAGAAVAGIGLSCSVVFVSALRQRTWVVAFVTGWGMLLFFGVEVWASLSERSLNVLRTPADDAVLSLFGVHNSPITPTLVIVAVLFPLGSLYFGFVQQRRAAVTAADLADQDMDLQRRVRQAEGEAQLAEALAKKRAAQARGAVTIAAAGLTAARQGFRSPAPPASAAASASATAQGAQPYDMPLAHGWEREQGDQEGLDRLEGGEEAATEGGVFPFAGA